MVISQIVGGLGNQLSQYCCGYSLAKYLGQELVLDVSDYLCRGYFRPYCMDKLRIDRHRKLAYPPVSANYMEEEYLPKELLENGLQIIDLSKVQTRQKLLDAVEEGKDVYLMGYGGWHYCTPEDREELRERCRPKILSVAVKQFQKRIQDEYSVAVHLRRTDFVDLKWEVSTEYFRAAITYVKIFHPDAQFYFFSDDIQYAKEQFGAYGNYHYVHLLGGMDADLDEFFCMSACDARILSARSSYSGWASELNGKEGKWDICQGEQWTDGQICLNRAAVGRLCSLYQPEGIPVIRTNAEKVISTAFQLISEGRNEQALEVVEEACFDSYGFLEEDVRKLTAIKEIALAQKGEEGLPAALRAFYEQMQHEEKDPEFHADYFLALYQAGCFAESAIHAAMANKLGSPENYEEYFCGTETMLFPLELYRPLKDRPARHFIFACLEEWNYFVSYLKSLAVILARMGQKVTFLHMTNLPIEAECDEEQVVRRLLRDIRFVDANYRYHMDAMPVPADIYRGGQRHVLLQKVIRQCAARFDMEAVVVTTMPGMFQISKEKGVKYVVPNIRDPLCLERIFVWKELEEYTAYMAERADAVFLPEDVFETYHARYGSKIRRAFPAWDQSKYRFFDAELDFTPNYIHSEEMIRNAAGLLMV